MQKNIYEEKSINKLIWVFSIPSIIALVIEMMTSIVDTIFAGHLQEISENALSALGIISPILSIFIAFQSLYSMSTAVFIAKYFKDEEKRQKYFIIGTIFSFLVSGLISIIVFIFMDKILFLLGAEGIIFDLAKQYLLIQLISNVFSSIGFTFTSAIRSFGYPKQEMIITILSVLVNIIFNTIFIFKLDLGFESLAFSTLISEFFCFIISLVYILYNKLFNKKYKVIKQDIKKGLELFKLGFAQTIIQILGSLSGFFINSSLILNASISYLAVWNIISKIYSIMLMPIVGITQGIRSIVAYYKANNQNCKKKKTIKFTIIYSFIYGILATILIFLFAKNIIFIFGEINDIYYITVKSLKIIISSLSFMGILYTIITVLEVTEQENKALFLILFRQVFIMIPIVYIIPLIFKNNDIYIFFSIPISDILGLIFSIILLKISKK